jgi:outer membrane protein TolC
MRLFASILAVSAATLLVSSAPAQGRAAPAKKDQAEESVKKVKELRKERITVLKDLTDQLLKLYQSARVPFDEVLTARQSLAEAELEAAETDTERVKIYKDLVGVLEGYESLTEARRKAGRGTAADVLKAKARRLQAEIHLEQVKMKLAKAKK